jgi:hypothetical protein
MNNQMQSKSTLKVIQTIQFVRTTAMQEQDTQQSPQPMHLTRHRWTFQNQGMIHRDPSPMRLSSCVRVALLFL